MVQLTETPQIPSLSNVIITLFMVINVMYTMCEGPKLDA